MDFKDLEKKLAQLISDIGDVSTMKKVADKTKDMIVKRTKSGIGVDKNRGKFKRLKPLKPSTHRRRRSLRASGDLSQDTTPTTSNLTQRGKMLGSIEGTAKRREAQVAVTGKENIKKAQTQADAGRKFMKLSDKEVSKVVNIIEEDIIKDIKKQGL